MHRHPSASRRSDDGFTLVELLIVIVILGVLATVTVFAVRGITDQGTASATDADERTLESAQEAHMAKEGEYATEADLVAAGLLRGESTLHDIDLAVDGQSYQIVAQGGGGGPVAPVPTGTPITFGGVPAVAVGSGPAFIVIGGATAVTEWNSLVAASQPTKSKTMVFVDIADIDTTTKAEDLHDASVAFARVFSLADDVANFSGAQPLSLYMELSNGAPQTYTKINDGSGRTVVWGFDY